MRLTTRPFIAEERRILVRGMAPPIQLKTSLDHLQPAHQARVRAAAEAIRREAPVDKIILFGSYARGDQVRDPLGGYFSDLDFLVVVESKAIADDAQRWGRAEQANQISCPEDLISDKPMDIYTEA